MHKTNFILVVFIIINSFILISAQNPNAGRIMEIDGPSPTSTGSDNAIDSIRNANNDRQDLLKDQPGMQTAPTPEQEKEAFDRYVQQRVQFQLDSIKQANYEHDKQIYDETQRVLRETEIETERLMEQNRRMNNENNSYDEPTNNNAYEDAKNTVESMDLSKQNQELIDEMRKIMPVNENNNSSYVEPPDPKRFGRGFIAAIVVLGITALFLEINSNK